MKSSLAQIAKLKDKEAQFKPQGPVPLRKLPGVKTYPHSQMPQEAYLPLEKVIGMSTKGTTSVSVNPISGVIAYPAGSIIVIYHPKENKQTKFLYSTANQRSFSCLAYSPDGKFLAAGEGSSRQPEITIWEIEDTTGDYLEIKHLRGHKYGIESVMFSPNMNYLVSLGDYNDRGLFVWDWRNEQRVTSNKLGKPVNTFAFSQSNSFFVTAGYQHLKYWHFDENGQVQKSTPGLVQAPGQPQQVSESIMESKSADLTKVKIKIFVGVQCIANGGTSGKEEQVLALASDGHLYVFDKNRKLTKWMNIKVERALSCSLGGDDLLFCACTEATIRIFKTKTLQHLLTIPKPPPLGNANSEQGKKIKIEQKKDQQFADAIALQVDWENKKLVVVYSDKMTIIWDIADLGKMTVFRSFYSHSGPIYDMQYIPNLIPVGFKEEGDSKLTKDDLQGITKFATCSADRTIRFWQFVDPLAANQQTISKSLIKNAYCKDLSKMIYVNTESRDSQGNPFPSLSTVHFKAGPIKLNEDGTPKHDETYAQQRDLDQLRCIRISPDGNHLATGDWSGNIHIFDISKANQEGGYDELQCIQAHDSEVLCLDFSPIESTQSRPDSDQINQPQESSQKFWLASGSRDRLTQIYEHTSTYSNVAILDDHSSTITSIRFAEEKSSNGLKSRIKLISSGADKQIVIRSLNPDINSGSDTDGANFQTNIIKKEQCKHKIFSMDIAGGYGITCHDKYFQLLQVTTQPGHSGNLEKVWERKAEPNRKQCDNLKVQFGPQSIDVPQSGINQQQGCEIAMISSGDKIVTLYETATGNAICRTTCGELTTAMCLSTNLKHLITTSMEGIIYVWRLPEQLTKALIKLRSEPNVPKSSFLKPIEQQLSSLKASSGNLAPDKQVVPSVTKPEPPIPVQSESSAQIEDNKSDEFDFNIADKQDKLDSMIDQSESMIGEGDSQYNQPPPSLSSIMEQITKAADKIDKIQPLQHRRPNAPSFEDQPEQQPTQPDQAASVIKKRVPWGASRQQNYSNSQSPMASKPIQEAADLEPSKEDLSPQQQSTAQARPLQFKNKALPRWAQSVADPQSEITQINRPPVADINQLVEEDIEDIFKNCLVQINPQPPKAPEEGAHGLQKSVFYGQIAEVDATKEEEEELKQSAANLQQSLNVNERYEDEPGALDTDEQHIRDELLMRNQHQKQMLGLDDEEEEEDATKRAAKGKVRQSQDGSGQMRQSQSKLFFQRKQKQQLQIFESVTSLQSEPLPQKSSTQQEMKVEDIFDESASAISLPQPEVKPELHQPKLKDISILNKVKELDNKRVDRYQPLNDQPEKKATPVKTVIILDDDLEGTQEKIVPAKPVEVASGGSSKLVKDYSGIMDESISNESLVQITDNYQTPLRVKSGNTSESQDEQSMMIKEELAKINQSIAKINQSLKGMRPSSIPQDVHNELGKSMTQWNNLTQSLNPYQLHPSSAQSQSYSVVENSQASFQPSIQGSVAQYSNMSSSVSIKDDARDLLDKYSTMLFQEVMKKMQQK